MKYLHIMLANGSSTYKFIRGLFDSLPREEFFEHEFIISETLNYVVKNAPNLLVYNYDNINYLPIKGKKTVRLRLELMKEKMEQADLIVWHSLLPMNTLKKAKLANKYCYKSAWVTMMEDRVKPNVNSKDRGAKKLAKEKIKFMKAVKYVNCSVPWFMKSFTHDYGENKVVSEIPVPIDSRCLEAMNNCSSTQDDKLRIVVGYNGRTANRHEMLFKNLNLQPEDDFCIIMPMNFAIYGEWGVTESWQYRSRVLENCVNYFGVGKAVKLRRKDVPIEEYFRMYASCDIGVFNDNRPLSMTLLFYMLYMGKKVFIKGSSVLVPRLRSLYLPVYSLAELKNMSAHELKAPTCDKDFLDMYRIEKRFDQPLTSFVEEECINTVYKWNKPSLQQENASEQEDILNEQDSDADEKLLTNVVTEDKIKHTSQEISEEQLEIYFKPMTLDEQAEISRRRAIGRRWLERYMSVSNTMERWIAWLDSVRNDSGIEDKFDMNVMEGLEHDEQASI